MQQGYIYILQSNKNGQYYLGSTIDPHKRLAQHNSGRTLSTQKGRPWKMKFYQEYSSLIQARQIENKLKRFRSKKILERIITEGKIITQ